MNHVLKGLIDVRRLPLRERHPIIFGAWKNLRPGEAILLVNDHDPVPLYHQFAAEHQGTFHWDYLEQGPEVFRVRITKGDFAEPGFVPAAPLARATPAAVPIEFVQPWLLDVRPILARGESPCGAIDDAVDQLIPGQPLVVLVPFEPVPLYIAMKRKGFKHQTRQLDDGTWQVEFRKER